MALYALKACLPPHIASRLTSIFLTTLVHTEDKKVKNENIFRKITEEINFLQTTGIYVNVNNVFRHVKFQLVLILGDNLGLNSIFGMVECFKANYFCRICKASFADCAIMIVENNSVLQTRENYEADVKKFFFQKPI